MLEILKSLCRKGKLLEEVHDQLTGHSSGSVGREYGEVPLETLANEIERIPFPASVPLPIIISEDAATARKAANG